MTCRCCAQDRLGKGHRSSNLTSTTVQIPPPASCCATIHRDRGNLQPTGSRASKRAGLNCIEGKARSRSNSLCRGNVRMGQGQAHARRRADRAPCNTRQCSCQAEDLLQSRNLSPLCSRMSTCNRRQASVRGGAPRRQETASLDLRPTSPGRNNCRKCCIGMWGRSRLQRRAAQSSHSKNFYL